MNNRTCGSMSALLKNRFIFILWFVFAAAMMVYLYNFINVRSDLSFFLPEDSTQLDEAMRYQLKHGEAGKILLIALKSKTNRVSAKQLAEVNKLLAKELSQNKNFVSVQNGQLSLAQLIIEPFYSYRYLLGQQTSESIDKRFSVPALQQSFADLLQHLEIMINPVEQKLFAEDPQMLWLELLKHWQAQKLKKQYNVWFDSDSKQTLMFVKTRAEGFNLDQQKRNIDEINKQFEQQIKKLSRGVDSDDIELVVTGAPLFALAAKKSISQQTKIISVIASFILMAFLYWFFRSVKIVLLTALPLAMAILTGITSVILSDGFIHGITIAFGITIIGIAVDYPVHLYCHAVFFKTTDSSCSQKFLHNQAIEEKQNCPQLLIIIRTIWPMMRLGLITTIIGFSAITFSDFSGLQQLGIFAISGLITAAMVTRYLLPLIPVPEASNKDSEIHSSQSKSAYNTLLHFVNYPIPRFIAMVPVFIVSAALVYIAFNQSNLWQNDLSALSPVPQWKKQQDFELRRAMGLPELRYVLILQDSNLENLLQKSEQLMPGLELLKKRRLISGYDMAAHYLPSIKHQKQQQQSLPETSLLRNRLQQVLEDSAFDVLAFSPFLNAVEKSRKIKPLSAEILLTDNLSQSKSKSSAQSVSPLTGNLIIDKLKTLLYQNKTSSLWTAIIPLQGVKNNQLKQQMFSSAEFLDLKARSESMLSDYRNEALLWFFMGVFLIIAVLFYSSQKVSSLFILVWPFMGAVVLTIASLLLLGYSLSIFHLVTLLLVVGLGIDYSVFVFFSKPGNEERAELKDQGHESAKISIIICMTSTLIMFGALSSSDLPVLKAIGLTASLGSMYAFVLTRLSISNRPKQD